MNYRSGLLIVALLVLGAGKAAAQTRIITGKVTDSLTGDVVISGQVSVQGTTLSTAIRDDGTFTLSVPTRPVVLTARSIGFKRSEVAVPVDQNSIIVKMPRDYFQLEAIVVTGQATGVEKKNLANAVSTVSADQLLKTPTATVENALQGKIAGAQISVNNGAPGGGSIVRMRGVTSIIGNFTPLYVVDGVIVSNASLGNGTNIVRNANGNDIVPPSDNQDNDVNRIADLNPDEIETVEVLKGASASAIYGSKASNGVIIITTKRGRVGAPQFGLTQRFGFSELSRKKGTRAFNTLAEAEGAFGALADNNWAPPSQKFFDQEDLLYGGRPLAYETDLSMNGGTETTRYFAALLEKHDGGIVPNTFANKQSLRLNVDQNIGSRLSFAVGADLVHSANDRGLTQNENNGAALGAGMALSPGFVDLRGTCAGVPTTDDACPDGTSPQFQKNPYGSSNIFQTATLFRNRESVWRSIASGRAQLDMVKSATQTLRFIGTGGLDVFTQKNAVLSPPELQFEQVTGIPGTSAVSFGQNQNFNVNGNVVHVWNAGSGTSATTQFGVQFESHDFDVSRSLTRNLIGGQPNIDQGTVSQLQERKERQRDLGLFAQEEFLTLNQRLLLTVGARADRSTNNADAKKLFFYPKSSISYRIPVGGPVSELKLRAALGESGNLPIYGQKFTELKAGNISGVPTSGIFGSTQFPRAATTAAPDLHPERQREFEAGVDATLFGSRGRFEGTVYEKRISDLELQRTLAPSSGFGTQIFNGGVMRTRGLELALEGFPVQASHFQWNARGSFYLSRCTIMSLPVAAFQPIAFLNDPTFAGSTFIEPGKSCTQIIGHDTLGALPGDAALGAIGSQITRQIADATPRYNFSIGNTFTVRKVSLYFLLDRQKGGVITNVDQFSYDAFQTSIDYNTPRHPGDLTGQQRFAAFANSVRPYLEDVSYLKLREVTLTVDLPAALTRRLWNARFVRIVASGRNLVTISPYWWSDPEDNQVVTSQARAIPWELWPYPASRSFSMSVDVGL